DWLNFHQVGNGRELMRPGWLSTKADPQTYPHKLWINENYQVAHGFDQQTSDAAKDQPATGKRRTQPRRRLALGPDFGMTILRVAVPVPLLQVFDYLPPQDAATAPVPGCRVAVPFGRGRRVGILVAVADRAEVAAHRLKPALAILDREPVLTAELLD